MNDAQVHLVFNHFPVVGMVFSVIFLGFSGWLKREELKKAALFMVVLSALFLIPTYFSGEAAEEYLESLSAVQLDHHLVEEHEELAEKVSLAVLVNGILAFGLLFLYRKRALPHWVVPLVFMLTVIVAALLMWTSHLGGMISHLEIRS